MRELEAVGVDQFNIYLMTHGQEETLQAFGDEIIPELSAPLPSLRQLLELPQAYPLSWSPDGSTLLVASDLPGTRQLFALPADGGEMEQLTDYAEPVSGFYLPDGRILVEIDEAGNERTQLHILGEGALVSDPRFNHWTPHVSKDGRRLAYTTNRRNGRDFDIVVRELASGNEKSFEIGGYVGVDSISPDGRWVVAGRGNELAGDNDLSSSTSSPATSST